MGLKSKKLKLENECWRKRKEKEDARSWGMVVVKYSSL
jgi:hypothetical protein